MTDICRQDADHAEIINRIARRGILAAAAGALLPWPFGKARADTVSMNNPGNDTTIAAQWQLFRTRFMGSDGRIVDTGNGGISHSEGQGWGMLFAEAAGDKDSFDLILAWTSTFLARRADALHIWKYDPSAKDPTADINNATDGDIFITWALARGAQRWAQPALSSAATAIATSIREKLCFQQSGQTYLLPGINGFVLPGALHLNPSYYVLPAFDTLALLAPSEIWASLRSDGLAMLQKAVFGQWSLPPDWLAVGRPGLDLSPATGWPPRFSFDAIRVPLWLTWANAMPPTLGAAYTQYWQSTAFPYRPAWINLTDGSYAGFKAPSGMTAIASLTLAAQENSQPQLPSVADATDYYSAALTMLSHLATGELKKQTN